MVSRIFISFLLIFSLNGNIFAQYNLSAVIKGKETAKITVVDSPSIITIKKSGYKNIGSFLIIVNSAKTSAAYKRTLELISEKGKVLYTAEEDPQQQGIFPFDLKGICKKILSQKIINLMLEENPSNPKMKIPSRIKQLAKVYLN